VGNFFLFHSLVVNDDAILSSYAAISTQFGSCVVSIFDHMVAVLTCELALTPVTITNPAIPTFAIWDVADTPVSVTVIPVPSTIVSLPVALAATTPVADTVIPVPSTTDSLPVEPAA